MYILNQKRIRWRNCYDPTLKGLKKTSPANDPSLLHNNGRRVMYNYTDDQYGVIKALKIATQKDDTIYKVIYFGQGSTFDDYLPTVKKMIESIEIFKLQFYEDVPNQIQIRYPSTWYINKTNNAITLNPSLNLSPRDNLTIRSFNSTQSLDTIINTINSTKKLNYEYIGKSNRTIQTTLGNFSNATELSYRKNKDGFNVMDTEILTKFNNKSYSISFISKENRYRTIDLPEFINDTINRFRIIEFTDYKNFMTFDHRLASIMFPTEWSVTLQENLRFAIVSPFNTDYASLVVSAFVPDSTLEESVSFILLSLEKDNRTDLKLMNYSRSTILNHPSYEMVYNYTDNGTTYIARTTISTFGTLTYQIDYTAEAEKYNNYLPVIEKMMRSLVIKSAGKQMANPSGIRFDSPIIDLAVNPLTHKLYLASDVANRIFVVDEFTGKSLRNLTVNGLPAYVTVSPSTNKIYVTSPEFNQIYVINGYTDNISSIIKVGNIPGQLALDPTDYTSSGGKGLLFVANLGDNNVSIIDASTEKNLENVTLDTLPYAISINPITKRAYVTSLVNNTVSVIDYGSYYYGGHSAKVIATVNMSSPGGIDIDPYRNHIFVGSSSGNVSEIDGINNKIIRNFKVGIMPEFLAFNKNTSELNIIDSANNTMYVLSSSQELEPKRVTIDGIASDIDIDPIENWIVTSSQGSKSLSFINGSSS